QYPLMLFHTTTPAEALSRSSVNRGQCNFAMMLLKYLSKSLTQRATLTINCYYRGDRDFLLDQLKRAGPGKIYATEQERMDDMQSFNWIQVRTVHSYIGEEADINILVTGQTKQPRIRTGEEFNPFVHDNRIANVSLTRAKHGLFVIGDFNFIANNDFGESA